MTSELTGRLQCTIMRGGTSKAVFLREEELPSPGAERDALILRVFGSPDRRQVDGLGGADPLTSKLAVIGAPTAPGADLDFTFGQVEIERPYVDYQSLCGNISSAVGLYAVQEGLVPPVEPVTRVVVNNTNLGRLLMVDVPVFEGKAVWEGNYRIAGVPGSGARIELDLSDTAGAATGGLLPTGNPIDVLDVPGVGRIEVSMFDLGNAHVFVRARDVGLEGIESAAELDAMPGLLERLESIRGTAAIAMGMATDLDDARSNTPATPLLGIISPSRSYVSASGVPIDESDVDLVSRLQFMQRTHKAHAGTSTAAVGGAARIPGTVVAEAVGAGIESTDLVRIGHPDGVIETHSKVEARDGDLRVTRATVGRTARRILDGTVYV